MVRMLIFGRTIHSGVMIYVLCPAFGVVVDLDVDLDGMQVFVYLSTHFELDLASMVPIVRIIFQYFTIKVQAVLRKRTFAFSSAHRTIVLSLIVQTCQTEASFLLSRRLC